MSLKLLIASSNLHKVREFRAMLKNISDLDIYSLRDFPNYVPPEENGESFEEIASLKAFHAAQYSGMLCLADDSGLVVDALNGEPGIYSARYAGVGASDIDNRRKLLANMAHLSEESRHAHFICAIALADPEKLLKVVSGKCEGKILEAPRGGHGFGYDPLFLKHDYGKTFAEMDEALKNRISHRHKAFTRMLPVIKQIVNDHATHH